MSKHIRAPIARRLLSTFALFATLLGATLSTADIVARPSKQAAVFDPGPSFKELTSIPGVKIDLRYATTNNFMNENLYRDLKTAYIHNQAHEKLKKAAANLQKAKPGWQLLIYDALRPRSVQKKLWAKVKGTPQEEYVADPAKGSIHNYGFAVDLTVIDDKGKEIDMGTGYDDFRPLAKPELEDKYLKSGELKPEQIANRKILRAAMESAGFIQLPNEWWHFDALPGKEVRGKHKIVE